MQDKKKKLEHIHSLETLVTDYKKAYSRHRQWHRQLLKVLVTSKEPQEKIFDILNIVRTIQVEDATEIGKRLS